MPVKIWADAKSFLPYKHRREDDVRRSCVIEKSSSGGTSEPHSSSVRETPPMWVMAVVRAHWLGATSGLAEVPCESVGVRSDEKTQKRDVELLWRQPLPNRAHLGASRTEFFGT